MAAKITAEHIRQLQSFCQLSKSTRLIHWAMLRGQTQVVWSRQRYYKLSIQEKVKEQQSFARIMNQGRTPEEIKKRNWHLFTPLAKDIIHSEDVVLKNLLERDGFHVVKRPRTLLISWAPKAKTHLSF
jgi:hypothetical protein